MEVLPESVMMGRETLAVKLKDSSPQDTTSTNVGQKTCVCVCVRETTHCYTLGTGHLRCNKHYDSCSLHEKGPNLSKSLTKIVHVMHALAYVIYAPFEMSG